MNRSIHQSISQSINLAMYQSIDLPICPSIHVFIYPSKAPIFELSGSNFSQSNLHPGPSEATLAERCVSLVATVCPYLILVMLSRWSSFSAHDQVRLFGPHKAVQRAEPWLFCWAVFASFGKERWVKTWKTQGNTCEKIHEQDLNNHQVRDCLQAEFMVQMSNNHSGATSWGSCPWTFGGGDPPRQV